MSIRQEVIKLISRFAHRSEDSISLQHDLRRDLDLDSLDLLELIMGLENFTGEDITEATASEWNTVEDVISAIEGNIHREHEKKTIRTAVKLRQGPVEFVLGGCLANEGTPTDWWFRFRVRGQTQAQAAQKLMDFLNKDQG